MDFISPHSCRERYRCPQTTVIFGCLGYFQGMAVGVPKMYVLSSDKIREIVPIRQTLNSAYFFMSFLLVSFMLIITVSSLFLEHCETLFSLNSVKLAEF